MYIKKTGTTAVRPLYVIVMLAIALSISGFSVMQTQASEGAARIWIAAFTYDVPAGAWAEGQHTYHFEWEWSVPEPGGSGSSNEAPLNVTNEAPLYNGYVLLRPLIYGVQARVGEGCINIDAVNPNQPTRFLAGFLTEVEMTYPEAQAYFESFKARVVWDNGNSAALVQHEIRPYIEQLWPNYVCTYTAVR